MPAKSSKRTFKSTYSETYRVNGSSPEVTDFPCNSQVTYDSWRSAGSSVPGYRRRIKQGYDCTTSLQGSHITIVDRKPLNTWFTRDMKDDFGIWQGPFTVKVKGYPWPVRAVQWPAELTIQTQKAEAIATKKFYTRLKEINQDMQGLVFLGELRETLRMLRKPASALWKAAEKDYIQRLRRYKKQDPRKWIDAIAGSWLEWQFGVQPLISDLKSAYDALDRLNWDPFIRKSIRVTGKDSEQSGPVNTHQWSANAKAIFTGFQTRELYRKVVYRALWARERDKAINLSAGHRMAESFGLNLREFVPTAWELMPWSFLIDYFTNIGDILEQSFASTSEVRWIVKTIIDDDITEIVTSLNPDLTRQFNTTTKIRFKSFDPDHSRPASVVYRRRSFTRDKANPPVSHFMWELPGSPFKYANIAALIAQADLLYPQTSTKRIWRHG